MSTARLEAVATDAKQDIPMQPASTDIWDKKYRLKTKQGVALDADIDGTYKRVAKALADAEPTVELQQYWMERFTWALRRGAIPAGRITSNAGALEHKPATSTINCTVSGTIQDSMDGILDKVHEAGLTLKAGCGIGYEFSTLRPRGAFVAGAGAYTSGQSASLLTASMKPSVISSDRLNWRRRPSSRLARMKSLTSGWAISNVPICAPRRPPAELTVKHILS